MPEPTVPTPDEPAVAPVWEHDDPATVTKILVACHDIVSNTNPACFVDHSPR